jgi:hypothetical protein
MTGVRFTSGGRTTLFATAFRLALDSIDRPSYIVGIGAISLGMKRRRPETDHSLPSSAKVQNAWGYTSTLPYVFMAWYLVKHRDNFTLPYLT